MLCIIFFAPYIEKVMKSNIFLKHKLKASLAFGSERDTARRKLRKDKFNNNLCILLINLKEFLCFGRFARLGAL